MWREGLDLNQLDVTKGDDIDWLRACIWPEHEHRRERLCNAVSIAAENPAKLTQGDLTTETSGLIGRAPDSAVKVLYHSAVLNYVEEEARQDSYPACPVILER